MNQEKWYNSSVVFWGVGLTTVLAGAAFAFSVGNQIMEYKIEKAKAQEELLLQNRQLSGNDISEKCYASP